MIRFVQRVSQLVLRTPHLPVLASLVDALFLSSSSSSLSSALSAYFPPASASPSDVLSALMAAAGGGGFNNNEDEDDSTSRSTANNNNNNIFLPRALKTLWRGGPLPVVATPHEWSQAELVEEAMRESLLSPWANTWKELMDKRLGLLRDEVALGRAVALARAVATVSMFVHTRCRQVDSTLKKRSAHRCGVEARTIVDVFIRRIPLSLTALLLVVNAADHPASKNGKKKSKRSSSGGVPPTSLITQPGGGGKKRPRIVEASDEEHSDDNNNNMRDIRSEEEEEESVGGEQEVFEEEDLSPSSQHIARRRTLSAHQQQQRYALAHALAMVAAPLASTDEDAWKVLHQYFSILFPAPCSSTSSLLLLSPTVEAQADALQVLLTVLSLHTARQEEEEEEEGEGETAAGLARIQHRVLAFTPCVFHAARSGIHEITANRPAEEEEGALTLGEAAVVRLLFGARVLLLSAVTSHAYAVMSAEEMVEEASAASVARKMNKTKAAAATAGRLSRVLSQVWQLIPRLLFSLRVQQSSKKKKSRDDDGVAVVSGNSGEGKGAGVTSPSPKSGCGPPPTGPLVRHPAMVDACVFAMLQAVWASVKARYPFFSSTPAAGLPNPVDLMRQSLPSLYGIATPLPPSSSSSAKPSALPCHKEENDHKEEEEAEGDAAAQCRPERVGEMCYHDGVLRRCSAATGRLAAAIAFYVGEEKPHVLPRGGEEKEEAKEGRELHEGGDNRVPRQTSFFLTEAEQRFLLHMRSMQ